VSYPLNSDHFVTQSIDVTYQTIKAHYNTVNQGLFQIDFAKNVFQCQNHQVDYSEHK